MPPTKSEIITQLQREILPLQSFRPTLTNTDLDLRLGPLKTAFPNSSFLLGAIHEFFYNKPADAAATTGFITGLLASVMQKEGAAIWIAPAGKVFPPALRSFGIAAGKIIFIDLKKEKEVLWAMEEALKCEGLAAVVGELKDISFTASRRLQLAVEKSRVTGFIFRNDPANMNTTACITRWRIASLASELSEGLPGVGFPRWNVELLKIRNGRPATWQLEFAAGTFRNLPAKKWIMQPQKKTG